jgi:(1->4)-alpha-D-glucan 1-alpha-D-glucosylmutase
VPDVYQGNDLWDLSLVDPDNRRPVDYALREKLLSDLKASNGLDVGSLLKDDAWKDGRSKLYLTWKALELRHERPELFEGGEYVPLEVTGGSADHVLAFARRRGPEVAITLATRLHTPLLTDEGPLLPSPETWMDTSIELPEDLAATGLRNVFTGEPVETTGQTLRVAEVLSGFPGALLTTEG